MERVVYLTVPVDEKVARHIDDIAHRIAHQKQEPYSPTDMCREILEGGFNKLIVGLPKSARRARRTNISGAPNSTQ